MKHGISFIKVNNDTLQEAINNKASKDYISYLKQVISYEAVYGFQYDEVSFEQLSNILSNDYGFTPFKYALEKDAIYNKEKHPHAWGRIRGRNNVNNQISWLCLDIDDTTITDEEMHYILGNLNHHIARTSNKDNPYKYRIIIQLSKTIVIDELHWKPFIKAVANHLGFKVDILGRSQVFYGYKGRKVYSTIDRDSLEPSRYLKIAHTKVTALLEKQANAVPKGIADKALNQPYSTFSFAYESLEGEGTTAMLGAIAKAKELGASREYIIDLLHSINNFWDHSMPVNRLQATVMSAI